MKRVTDEAFEGAYSPNGKGEEGRKDHLPARMFSTALATMKFLSDTRPWMGFSSLLGTACFFSEPRLNVPTKQIGKGMSQTI